MLKLIVFDCDGVMFDSKGANKAFYNNLLSHFSLPPMSAEEEEYVHMHNVSSSIGHILRHHGQTQREEVEAYRKTLSYRPFLKFMSMEPDLVTFLDIVSTRYHLAISTNRTNTMIPLLKEYNLDRYFGMVMTAATAPRPKPAPDGLEKILEFYQCSPDEALFLGDSVLDEQHAAACKVPLVAFKSPTLNATFHVNSFMEILDLPPLA